MGSFPESTKCVQQRPSLNVTATARRTWQNKLSNWWNDISAQSFDMTPSIDKPKRQHNISYSPIDNIFISNRERIVQVSSNIISDLSDHFSQFCFLGSSSKLFDV